MYTNCTSYQAVIGTPPSHLVQNTPPSLVDTLANDPPPCAVCSTAGPRRPSLPGDPSGAISWLPRKHQISIDSYAHQQGVLNEGAFNHPCLIAMTSACGHLVFCMPITSFGNETIQGKYASCHNPRRRERIFNDYVALRNGDTVPHNLLGELDYAGQEMDKQSYVHLDFGYWIEWYNLVGKSIHQLRLESLYRVRQLYANAEIDRRQFRSMSVARLGRPASISPPPRRPNTPPSPGSTSFDTVSWRCDLPISPPPSPTRTPCYIASPPNSTPAWRRNAPTFGLTESNGAPSFVPPRRGNAAIPILPPSPPLERRELTGKWRQPVAAA